MRDASYHVLLVGVDDYRGRPLGGCVNDIDAVQRLLLGPRMGLAKDRIRRLTSPLPDAIHETTLREDPATLANIRAALAELGSDRVSPGDRVFIYYSGHGSRVEVVAPSGRRFHREALVPVDYNAQPSLQLLFDFELNGLLRAIVERTRSVAVMLDCCHADSVTRHGIVPAEQQPRFLDLTGVLAHVGPLPDPADSSRAAGLDAPAIGGIDACHVVSACLGPEVAKEDQHPDGMRNGLLTRAFIAALDATAGIHLQDVSWARIWQTVRADVQRQNPWQHPSMTGNAGRAVFAGPPVDGDPGIPVIRDGDRYHLLAGTMADVTPGAELAIYGATPRHFWPFESPFEVSSRAGTVRVISAERATATAEAVGRLFDLPPGARARPVKAGASARLRCAVTPANAEIEHCLAASQLLEVVKPSEPAPVRLRFTEGHWFVTDDKHGDGRDAPVLFALPSARIRRARVVLEHYYAYSRPLRVAALAGDLPGGLELSVLSCPADELSAAEAQAATLEEARSPSKGTYELPSRARVCFCVGNRSTETLRVTLLNCAASGKVQLLGDQVLDAGTSHVFWALNNVGMPFRMSPPPGMTRCIDRLIAIGRTALDHALDYLCVDRAFADIEQETRGDPRDIDGGGSSGTPPRERWTAAQVIIETRRT